MSGNIRVSGEATRTSRQDTRKVSQWLTARSRSFATHACIPKQEPARRVEVMHLLDDLLDTRKSTTRRSKSSQNEIGFKFQSYTDASI